MKKTILTIIILIFLLCINSTVYAGWYTGYIDFSDKAIETGVDPMPLRVVMEDSHDNKVKELFAFDVENDVIDQPWDAITGDTIIWKGQNVPYKYGQIYYFGGVDNNGNPYDWSVLLKPENFFSNFYVTYNLTNRLGTSYISNRNKTYPTYYPNNPLPAQFNNITIPSLSLGKKNYNFKVPEDLWPTPATATAPNGIKGVFRNAFASYPLDEYTGTMNFPTDLGSYNGIININPSTLVEEPWINHPEVYLDKGKVNRDYENNNFKVTQPMIDTYLAFETFYPSWKTFMQTKGASSDVKKTETFLRYASVRTYSTATSYGIIQLKFRENGVTKYIVLRTPKILMGRDIAFYQPSDPTNYKPKLWDPDPDGNGIWDGAKYIDPVLDTLEKGKEYVWHTYLYMTSANTTDQTYNTDLKTNFYIAKNKGTKVLVQKDVSGVIVERPTDSDKHLKIVGGKTEKIDYSVKYTVPEEPTLTELTFEQETPDQYGHYHSDDIDKDDNSNFPDNVSLTFKVKKSSQDLKITDFTLKNKDGTGISGDLVKDKEYTVNFTIQNTSKIKTVNTVTGGLSNQAFGESFTVTRDSSVGTILTSSSGTNPIPPNETITFTSTFKLPATYTGKSLSLTAFIPKNFDDNDNVFIAEDDIRSLTYNVRADNSDNLFVNYESAIMLYGTDGTLYNTLNADGTYQFRANKWYKAVLRMKKTGDLQLGSSTNTKDPKIELRVTDRYGMHLYKLRADSWGYYDANLGSNEKELTYTSQSFQLTGNEAKIEILVPEEYNTTPTAAKPYNSIQSDDRFQKEYSSSLDLYVNNFIINPREVFTTTPCTGSQVQQLSFSAELGVIDNDIDRNITDVSIVIRNKAGVIVFRDDHFTFAGNTSTRQISGNFNSPSTLRINNFNPSISGTQSDSNVFTLEIDANNVYQEEDETNNNSTASVKLTTTCNAPTPPICVSPNTQNSWGPVRFDFTKRSGSHHAEWITLYRCVSYNTYSDNKGGSYTSCSKYEPYPFLREWCDPDNWENSKVEKNFKETFAIKSVMFRSQDSVNKGLGWVNILNKAGTVKAGQWYELYIETEYWTDRKSGMPTPNPYRNDMCNFLQRTPNYNTVYNTPPFITLQMAGYGTTESYTLYGTSEGGEGYIKKFKLPPRTDKFGETNTRRYIPVDGKDGTINFQIKTKEFNGYTYDGAHNVSYKPLCTTGSAQVKINGSLGQVMDSEGTYEKD